MRIGVDLDGVMVDFVKACAIHLRLFQAEDVQKWDDIFTLSGLKPDEFFEQCRIHHVFGNAHAINGAVLGVVALIEEQGHDVVFITHRPEWAREETYQWLINRFPGVADIRKRIYIVGPGYKSEVECDLYLDDSPFVLSDLREAGKTTVRFEQPWNADVKATYTVGDWDEFVALVTFLEREKQRASIGWRPADTSELAILTEQTTRLTAEIRVIDPETGGQKGSKPQRMDLLPYDTLLKVSEHYAYGAEKYEDRNWEKGYAWHLNQAALLRHLAAWWQGEDVDIESGSHHLAAVVFHALALYTFVLRGIGKDDRPSVGD